MPVESLPHVIQLTPPGRGAIATLRVEGPGAVAAVEPHFRGHGGRPLAAQPADRLTVGRFGGPRSEKGHPFAGAGPSLPLLGYCCWPMRFTFAHWRNRMLW